MRKLFFAALLLTSLNGMAQSACRVLGTTTDIADGSVITLGSLNRQANLRDSAIVKDGKFEFTIPINEVTTSYPLVIGYNGPDRKWAATWLFAEPDATLKMTFGLDYDKHDIMGSPLNYIQRDYRRIQKGFTDRMMPLRQAIADTTLTAEARKEAERQWDEIYKEMVKSDQDFAYRNLDNVVGLFYLYNMAAMMDRDFLAKALAEVPAKFNSHPYVTELREALVTEAKTAEGQPFIDLTMDDPKGKQVSLSQYIKKNKLTLVDFWASWCGPCRAALPGVKRIYETYKKKGLGVVGVSFDSRKESWLKAIKDLELPWPQMSDLKGWECAASPAYNIKAIPFTLLITQDGTIVGRNLDGEEAIETKIKEILK